MAQWLGCVLGAVQLDHVPVRRPEVAQHVHGVRRFRLRRGLEPPAADAAHQPPAEERELRPRRPLYGGRPLVYIGVKALR